MSQTVNPVGSHNSSCGFPLADNRRGSGGGKPRGLRDDQGKSYGEAKGDRASREERDLAL